MYSFIRISLALPSFALSLSRANYKSRYRCLSHTRRYSRDIIVLSCTRCLRAIVLSFFRERGHLALLFSLSRANFKSRGIIVLSRTHCSRNIIVLFHTRSLSLTYLCIVLLAPMRHFTMRCPCLTSTSSSSHTFTPSFAHT